MIKYLKYARYLFRHKKFVLQAGLKTKAPLWNLIIHDWSKFLPSEFFPYAEWFYGWNGQSWYDYPKWLKARTEEVLPGMAPLPLVAYDKAKHNFEIAWNYHQKRNPHHYQFWTSLDDKGGVVCLPAPEHIVREMVADWIGAGMAISGRNDVREWYLKNRDAIKLHPTSRDLVCKLIGDVSDE